MREPSHQPGLEGARKKKKRVLPKKTQVSVRGETYAQIKAEAQRLGVSVCALVDQLCVDWLVTREDADA